MPFAASLLTFALVAFAQGQRTPARAYSPASEVGAVTTLSGSLAGSGGNLDRVVRAELVPAASRRANRAPRAANRAVFSCTPVAVWDGDGPIWCQEGPRIRLEGIAARERDGTCRPGHPCPRASAEASWHALVNLLGGPRGTLRTGHIQVRYPTMQCRRAGTSHERVVASCQLSDGRDLSAAMIRTGTVLEWHP